MLETLLRLAPVAMADSGAGAGGPGGMLGSPLFLIAMIAVMFYFLLWKPEQKKKQERERLLKNLSKGDEVMTAGGIYGKITALTDQNVTIEIAPGVRVKISRQHVSNVAGLPEEKSDKSKDKDKGENGKK